MAYAIAFGAGVVVGAVGMIVLAIVVWRRFVIGG
jgi:hypothetical protein